jgi:hypothetical protein
MNKSDIEESKRFFNHRYQTEKDRDIKKFIGQLESLVEEINFESFMHFRKTFEDRVFDFKKENGRVSIAYLENSKLDTNTYKEKVYEEKKETFQKLDFENYEKVETKGTKKIGVLINSFDELIDAIKCVLWSLDNEPSTIIKIFQHILVMKNNQRTSITQDDYEITNELIEEAVWNSNLYLQKKVINRKTIWFYSNPTDKRTGYFLDGKLRTLRQIEKYYDIPRATLHNRLKKMNIDQAVKK